MTGKRLVTPICPFCRRPINIVIENKLDTAMKIVTHDEEDGGCGAYLAVRVEWRPDVSVGVVKWESKTE